MILFYLHFILRKGMMQQSIFTSANKQPPLWLGSEVSYWCSWMTFFTQHFVRQPCCQQELPVWIMTKLSRRMWINLLVILTVASVSDIQFFIANYWVRCKDGSRKNEHVAQKKKPKTIEDESFLSRSHGKLPWTEAFLYM